MKHQLLHRFISLLFVSATASLIGCYTQLGTVRSDRDSGYDRERAEQADKGYEAYDDSTGYGSNDEYYDDYLYQRNRLGFTYYYPTILIGSPYYDPWYYGRWGWNSYYDPFICGTAYPGIYAGWYYPHYWYNDPWYYGGYSRYRDYTGGRIYGATRTFGKTRGGGSTRVAGGTRGNEGSYQPPARGGDLPVGYRPNTTTGRSGAKPSVPPKVSTGKRGGEHGQRGGSRTGAVGRGGNTRGSGSREGTRVGRPSAPPSHQPSPPRDNGGSRSGEGRSYSPPPSTSQPAPSSPPSGGRAPSSTGARGGSRR
jgi:hypothetical protein